MFSVLSAVWNSDNLIFCTFHYWVIAVFFGSQSRLLFTCKTGTLSFTR